MTDLFIHMKEIFRQYQTDEVTVYAAQASFFIVIAFFPFIMFLLTLLQFVPAVTKSDLLYTLITIVPDMLDSLVVTIVDDLYTKSPGTVISLTAALALWSASRGMLAIERGLNRVYESTHDRGYLLRRIICMGYTLFFVAACIGSLLILVLGDSIQGFFSRWFPLIASVTGYVISLRSLIAFWLLVLIFDSLYTVVPAKRHSLRSQLPGALFSTLGWMIASWLFSFYFNNFSNYSYMYGSLTAIVLLMLWLYLCICILLIGAEINDYLISHTFRW